MPEKTDVLIVGAGPSGLSLAIALKQLNVDALVVDKLAAGANTSRAAVIHARTLEMLETLGVTSELVAAGLQVPTFRIRERARVLLTIGFEALPTAYPFTLMCPQSQTETILLHRLHALGGQVVRPAEVVTIRPEPGHVEAQITDGEVSAHVGVRRTIQAQWVIGCDGAHSAVRHAAGIAFQGAAYDEDFVLADVHMDWPLSRQEVSLFFAAAGLVVVAPLPGNRVRLVATVCEAPEHPQMEYMQDILNRRGPGSAAHIKDVVWASRFRIQHRIADTIYKGRIVLCGDAAHVHSPAGGQGMNTGIQDAVSLAAPLVTALQSGNTSDLAAWARKRHSVAKSVVGMTDKITRVATLSSPPARFARNVVLGLIGRLPKARQAVAGRLAELDSP